MKFSISIAIGLAGLSSFSAAQYLTNGTFASRGPRNVRYDTGSFGPDVEEFHYYYDQWRKYGLEEVMGRELTSSSNWVGSLQDRTCIYLLYARHLRIHSWRGCE